MGNTEAPARAPDVNAPNDSARGNDRNTGGAHAHTEVDDARRKDGLRAYPGGGSQSERPNPVSDSGKVSCAGNCPTTIEYFRRGQKESSGSAGSSDGESQDGSTPKQAASGVETNNDGRATRGNEGRRESQKESDAQAGRSPGERAVAHYTDTLTRAGFDKKEAGQVAKQTYDRFKQLEKEGHLTGGAESQLDSVDKSMNKILNADGTYTDSSGVRRLADGQRDYMSNGDRKNMVKDLSERYKDPDKYETQGKKLVCGLESAHKQHLEAGNVKELAEQEASLVNTGSAVVRERDRNGQPGKERTVHVNSLSFKPDAEAREAKADNPSHTYSAAYHSATGSRGLGGQVADALYGQVNADLKAERQGQPTSAEGIDRARYVYLTANASDSSLGNMARNTATGEAFYEQHNGRMTRLLDNNPSTGAWDLAALNRATGGNDGAVFANEKLATAPVTDRAGRHIPTDAEGRPLIDPTTGRRQSWDSSLHLNTFSNQREFANNLREFQNRTGQSGQVCVDAPFLPGGGRDGHGLHAVNMSVNDDNTFNVKNNWGDRFNLNHVSGEQIETATNPDRWVPQNGGGGRRPSASDDFVPRSGTNPNETFDDAKHRQELQKKDEEQLRKEREAERKREEQKRREEEIQQRKAMLRQEHESQFQAALAQWKAQADGARESGLVPPPMPDRGTFVQM